MVKCRVSCVLFEEDVDGGSNDSETNAAIDVSPQIPLVHQTHATHSMLQHGSLMFPANNHDTWQA